MMSQADDSVIIELNDALPTQSFHPVNSRATCESVGKRLVEQQKERLALIQRCLEENERRAQTVPEGTFEARIVRNTVGFLFSQLQISEFWRRASEDFIQIRQIRAEFEVEEIIGARTRKAVDERCGKIF
ncbi:hypothetical protein ANCDUO_22338 [Ancylostoma duodenale]|uniref:Protein MIX23 n=1 Tax=Ancylostoma duodenale TaxID=51022 RepID=A0A0C2FLF7_9BILA|nr:hypothetical protein ANCDUO_22338 [Ancylostoma duodenale]